MSAHTPGPWKLVKEHLTGDRSKEFNTIVSKDRIIISLPRNEESNARLIAAAPELLNLLERFCGIDPTYLNHEANMDEFNDIQYEAFELIKKIEGEK